MPTEYNYSTAPQPVKPGKKYRDEEAMGLTLMSDPRVMRGSTAALAKKVSAAKTAKAKAGDKTIYKPTTQEPSRPTYFYEPAGFVAPEIDLSLYLTQQVGTIVPSKVADSQTDEFHPRPLTPEYIPRKTGIDTSTQIEDVNDLFNFDLEVAPMLDVIVGKTIEQALFELGTEAELAWLERIIQERTEEKEREEEWKREKEKASTLEFAEAMRLKREKTEEKQGVLKAKTLAAGLAMMHQILPGIIDAATDELFESGMWQRPVKETAKNSLNLMEKMAVRHFDAYNAAREVADELLKHVEEKFEQTATFEPRRRRMELTIIVGSAEGSGGGEEDGAVEPDIKVSGATGGRRPSGAQEGTIGPIFVDEDDTLLTLEKKIENELVATGKPVVKFDIRTYFVAALDGRSFAADAALLNFPFPSSMNIFV